MNPASGRARRCGAVRPNGNVVRMSGSFDPQNDAEFDAHAARYHEMHSAVLTASGESPEYFSQYKRDVVAQIIGDDSRPILDFGCGIGNMTALLAENLADVHGYDPSARSVEVARQRSPDVTFHDSLDSITPGTFGTIIVANVLHHVPPAERSALIATIVPLLAPGGRLMVFEHNRWNPLTVRAVRQCEFDVGVSLLSKPELKRLLAESGLESTKSRFIVFFPHVLRSLRPLEPRLGVIPMGAQMCVWSQRAS